MGLIAIAASRASADQVPAEQPAAPAAAAAAPAQAAPGQPAVAAPQPAAAPSAQAAAGQPAAPPPGPAVTTIYDERIAAPVKTIVDGKLVLAVDPERQIAMDEISVVELGNTPQLAAQWIGQDNHDLVQVGGAVGANGVQDIHLRLSGLAGAKKAKQIVVLTRGGKGRGAWRLDTAKTPNWKLAVERAEGSPTAELYLEPINHDCFERAFEITITYEDGATSKTSLQGTTHTDHQLKMGAGAGQPQPAPAGPPAVVIYGRDKTVLRGELLDLGEETVAIKTPWHPEVKLALTEVRGIAFTGVTAADARQQFETRLADPAADDAAVVLGRDQAVQQVTGNARAVVDGKLKFNFEGEDRSIGVGRLAGVVYAKNPRRQPNANPYQLIQLLTGDVVAGVWASVDEKELGVETAWGGRLAIPRSAVARVGFRNGKVTYISDLDPLAVDEVPYFGHRLSYRRDQGFDGGPLKLKGKNYTKGLAAHSRSVLTYAVDGQYESFKAIVGFDETGRGRGRVICRVLGDGRELYAQPDLRATAEPVEIDVPLSGVKQLALEIDFGEAEDTGDRVLWADARIFRATK
ncbi:MAG TPA: NPCBM/NEW2 domain-containing protein [Pirellulales bacterium]